MSLKNFYLKHEKKILAAGVILALAGIGFAAYYKSKSKDDTQLGNKGEIARVNVRQTVRCSNDKGVELDLEEVFKEGKIFYKRLELSPGRAYTCVAAGNDERIVSHGENSVKMFLLASERYPVNGYVFDKNKGTVTFAVHENDAGLYELMLPVADKTGKIKTRRLEFLVKTGKSLAETNRVKPRNEERDVRSEYGDSLDIGSDTVYGGRL